MLRKLFPLFSTLQSCSRLCYNELTVLLCKYRYEKNPSSANEKYWNGALHHFNFYSTNKKASTLQVLCCKSFFLHFLLKILFFATLKSLAALQSMNTWDNFVFVRNLFDPPLSPHPSYIHRQCFVETLSVSWKRESGMMKISVHCLVRTRSSWFTGDNEKQKNFEKSCWGGSFLNSLLKIILQTRWMRTMIRMTRKENHAISARRSGEINSTYWSMNWVQWYRQTVEKWTSRRFWNQRLRIWSIITVMPLDHTEVTHSNANKFYSLL